ncbi:MAG TPA: amylo-alpha-1,6-glucosidase [Gemmatimonadales bacterium]|nr:amylo-alpha-1,6-glucosidase [Gemmatimonadales bacterium]
MTTHIDEDVIRIEEHYYIRATSSRADGRTRVLKQDDTFGVFDRFGDVLAMGMGEQGVFHQGTRHLSRLELRLGQTRPLLLSSTISEANDTLAVDLTNPDLNGESGGLALQHGVVHLLRSKFLWQGTCYERLVLANYGLAPVALSLTLNFAADFVDIFEVRGTHRQRRGQYLEPELEDGVCVLGYQGLDGVIRRTRLEFHPRPAQLDASVARFAISLEPQAQEQIFLAVRCESGPPAARPLPAGFDESRRALSRSRSAADRSHASVSSGNEQFNQWISRSRADLQMMLSTTPYGLYPYAGVPWFSTVFGRDGIITALQLLWLDPDVARGVLAYLAANQATELDPARDAEPGKILHETRTGEMAALGEVPFGRYYGSVDATPLFVMLAGAYFDRTGDREFLESLWPAIERALTWIDQYGDSDGDGFVEYRRHTETGLVQQGWKDSHDSVFHPDGALAEPPIALCEVQGYVYAARRAAAELALVLGRTDLVERQREAARRLRQRFEEEFWCEELGTYALALDGKKRPCRVRSSNPGHCLFTGIVKPSRAKRVARSLLDSASFSGWGIRTLGSAEVRYNPMSYHNGSVWPHDNAIIAAGFARYGLREAVLQPFEGLFEAATYLDLHRMPELFCGFERRPGEAPTLYPVACLPQAWASGSVYMLLQACLGLSVEARTSVVRFSNPLLPEWLPSVRIYNLEVGRGSLDLLLERHPHDVGVTVLRREGKVGIDITK